MAARWPASANPGDRVADAAAMAEAAARSGDRADRCQSGQHRDLSDRRVEPEAALSSCWPPIPTAAGFLGPRPLVHRRRPVRAGRRSTQQHGDGAARSFSTLRAGRQDSPDPNRHRRSRQSRAALRERTEIVLRRRPPRPGTAAVRSGADGCRAGWPYRLAVSRLSRRQETERWVVGVPKANVEPFVPRVTLTFPALDSCHEMLFEVAARASARL